MIPDPNLDHIETHLKLLYDWTHELYPNAQFEMRCLANDCITQRFACSPAGYQQAMHFAIQYNDQQYNIYISANPLPASLNHPARDQDVEMVRYSYVDCDGTDDPVELIQQCSRGFAPAFVVTTGSIPQTRCQIYWRHQQPIRDLTQWRQSQRGLAEYFESDKAVLNPSRLLRLAGTLSFPHAGKIARGYQVELTALDQGNGEVETNAFAAAFTPQTTSPQKTNYTTDTTSDATAKLPLKVIEAALQAIPPTNDRNVWLDIAHACKDAHPESWHLFDQWQRQSERYHPRDENLWRTLATPSTGSFRSLLAHAKRNDRNWWRNNDEAHEWCCQQAASMPAEIPPTNERQETHQLYRYNMHDMKNIKAPNWLIPDLLFEQQVAVMYAPPESFKSFVAITLGSMLVHGMQWQDKPLKKTRVLYVAGEGFPMFYFRRKAWFDHHKIPVHNDQFEVVRGAVILTNTASVAEFIEAMRDCTGLGLLVIDTLSTSIVGQNESDSGVMSLAVANAKLIGRVLGCAVLLIHHPGKDVERGSRGHSALRGDIDAEWRVSRYGDEPACTLRVTKQKDGERGQEFKFLAQQVPLDLFDQDGEEITSLVLVPEQQAASQFDVELADRIAIAQAMELDEEVSLSRLAARLRHQLGARAHAICRINRAVPQTWIQVRRGDAVVSIRRSTASKSGQAHCVEMRIGGEK